MGRPIAADPPATPSVPLLLACGNSLRQDDGIGLKIAEAAERRFPSSCLRVIAAPQWTPEMAADLAATDLAIFVDANIADEPAAVRVTALSASSDISGSHCLNPSSLLAMSRAFCGRTPARAFALTVGAASFGYAEELSGALRQAVPQALRLLECLLGICSAGAPVRL